MDGHRVADNQAEIDFWVRLRDGAEPHNRVPIWRPAETPGADLKFPPVDNGLDYLVSVVDFLAPDEDRQAPSARALKYAVLHLQAAAEVLLKARLEAAHWTLVAEDITRRKVTRAKFEQGDFNSIAPDEAVRRLRDIVGVEIPTEAATNLDALHKKRNALQHYGLNATQEDIEPVAAKVLDFLIAFLDETLLPALDPAVRARAENDMTYVRRGLHLIQSFVAARLERLAPELAGLEDRTVQCTRCFQDTLVAGDGEAPETARCRFCHVAFAPEVIAAEYVGVHNAGMFASGATEVCTKCGGTEAVVRHVIRVCDLRPDQAYGIHDSVTFCFACAAPAGE
ncbi:hypothetical protein AB0D54_32250 [Streptomyces xanthophaeus]|uniref:hypothetical protein n=1 Tax=Streptomyces xanthophaeus TaxID=67385 RepID=UPI00343CEBAE